jgi:hypothetical protein
MCKKPVDRTIAFIVAQHFGVQVKNYTLIIKSLIFPRLLNNPESDPSVNQCRRLGCCSIATQRNRGMLGCQKDGNPTYAAV